MIVKARAGTLVVNDHANYVVQVGFDCKGKVVRVAGTIDKLHREERKLQQLRESQAALRLTMRLMDETALAAMKRSAVEGLTAQLLGIAELKHNRETAELEREKHNERAKLHNVSLFMGQLTAIVERQTKTPDWGEW